MKKQWILLAALFLSACTGNIGGVLPMARPDALGMDPIRLSKVDGVIENAIAKGDVPGAVLAVVRHGKTVYLKAYGNKQVEPDTIPMTVNTVFDMASVSKCVGTTLSMMQLIEQGKVRMQDRVDLYIPGFEPWVDTLTGEKIPLTIVDLMTHTSGLPPYGPTAALVEKYGWPSPQGLMEYICHCPRDFKPTTGYQYSCLNFITLQNVLQNITGERLCDYAQKNVFDVLGLKNTGYIPLVRKDSIFVPEESKLTKRLLKLCGPTEVQPDGKPLLGQVHDPLARLLNAGNSGNAGVFSNAEDLAVIAAALLNGGAWNNHRILGPLTVKAMATVPAPVKQFGRTPGWGNDGSWNGNLFDPQTVYGHTGYTGTTMVLDPTSDTAVILLTNRVHPHDEGSAVQLRTLVANVVAGAIME